jgi:threonine-phosphate decarboxylase
VLEFAHGGDIKSFAKDINCKVEDVIDLSSNINFIKPDIKIDFNNLDISSYPNYDNLYQCIAQNYDIDTENMELFNGGSSAIFSLFGFLKSANYTKCTIYSPAYLEYKKAANIFDFHIKQIDRLEHINQMVLPNSLVIFVNPSTPDGQLYDIKEYLDYWKQNNCVVLIDESFLDFTNAISATKYLDQYNNIFILKSMTKFYSSAGIRVGVMISNSQNIKQFKLIQSAWKISQFDSVYIQEALKDTNFKTITKSININNNILLKKVLHDSNLFEKVYDSKANYMMAKLKNIDAITLQNHLKRYKIMIRDCSNFDFLDSSYIRVAVKSEQNIMILKKALKSVDQ